MKQLVAEYNSNSRSLWVCYCRSKIFDKRWPESFITYVNLWYGRRHTKMILT